MARLREMVLDEETRLRFSFFISKYCNRTLNPGCWTPDPGRRERKKLEDGWKELDLGCVRSWREIADLDWEAEAEWVGAPVLFLVSVSRSTCLSAPSLPPSVPLFSSPCLPAVGELPFLPPFVSSFVQVAFLASRGS